MKNLFILPSKKPSRLLKSQNNNFMIIKSDTTNWFEIILKNTYQNIYITNNDGLNENDYVITDDVDNYGKLFQVSWLKNNKIKNCYKVILTTDHDLIKNGVQAIDDEFLEWFIKHPSCEIVETERLEDGQYVDRFTDGNVVEGIYENYKIIIPKEEPKTVFDQLEVGKDYKQEVFELGEEPKQETLEEVIDSYIYKNSTELNLPDILTNAIMFGAKFQNELILDFLHSEITERRDYSASKMCEKIIEFIKNK